MPQWEMKQLLAPLWTSPPVIRTPRHPLAGASGPEGERPILLGFDHMHENKNKGQFVTVEKFF
jgi:hypothetical protein